jgi:hypothetical protein
MLTSPDHPTTQLTIIAAATSGVCLCYADDVNPPELAYSDDAPELGEWDVGFEDEFWDEYDFESEYQLANQRERLLRRYEPESAA